MVGILFCVYAVLAAISTAGFVATFLTVCTALVSYILLAFCTGALFVILSFNSCILPLELAAVSSAAVAAVSAAAAPAVSAAAAAPAVSAAAAPAVSAEAVRAQAAALPAQDVFSAVAQTEPWKSRQFCPQATPCQ